MNTFMISIGLPTDLTQEFISLIPKQRTQVDKLMDEGKILHYSLALDRSQLWVTIGAKTEHEAMENIRITLGRHTTKEDLIHLIKAMKEISIKYTK